MKIAVVGSRSVAAIDAERIGARAGDTIVTGGARGADALAEAWARAHGIAVTVHRPDYSRYGRNAPHVRNAAIIADADRVVAFWDGKSRGTASVIAKARRGGKQVEIIDG